MGRVVNWNQRQGGKNPNHTVTVRRDGKVWIQEIFLSFN